MHNKAITRSQQFLKEAVESLLSIVFPPHCVLCGSFAPRMETHSFCTSCWSQVMPLLSPLCSRCGLPLPSSEAFQGVTSPCCGPCSIAPPSFQLARAYAAYQDVSREMIHLLKFGGRKDLSVPMGRWLTQIYLTESQFSECEAVVPVPLHRERHRERGFNQAELLARQLARHTGLKVWSRVLARRKKTLPQSGLTDAQRRENIRGAFIVKRPAWVAGKKLLLVDDVYTPGATLSACSRALKEAGAAGIYVLTMARVARHI